MDYQECQVGGQESRILTRNVEQDIIDLNGWMITIRHRESRMLTRKVEQDVIELVDHNRSERK